MPEVFDLHCHSVASDGVLTPRDVVLRAQARGVTRLALTDHDTLDGLAEAQAQADILGLGFVPGVEISTTWDNRTIHIVGLNINPQNAVLRTGLEAMREVRQARTEAIAAKLEKAGVQGALKAVYEEAGDASAVSRTHFARLMVNLGRARDLKQAFKKYFTRGGIAYVATQWASLADSVSWIRAAGGVAVVAHPGRYQYTTAGMRRLLSEFKQAGGQALEVLSSAHGREDIARLTALTREFEFCYSVGSDFHGPGNPQAELGAQSRTVEGCRPVWELFETGTR